MRGRRPGWLPIVGVTGLLVAAAAAAGTLVVASTDARPTQFHEPLRVYPVSQQMPGHCPGGTRGLTGQRGSGTICYQLTDGMTIKKATGLRIRRSNGGYEISMSLMPAQRRALARVTRAAVGKEMALVVRNKVVTAPSVDQAITGGRLRISGMPTRSEAQRLVDQLTGVVEVPQPVPASPTPSIPSTPGTPVVVTPGI